MSRVSIVLTSHSNETERNQILHKITVGRDSKLRGVEHSLYLLYFWGQPNNFFKHKTHVFNILYPQKTMVLLDLWLNLIWKHWKRKLWVNYLLSLIFSSFLTVLAHIFSLPLCKRKSNKTIGFSSSKYIRIYISKYKNRKFT